MQYKQFQKKNKQLKVRKNKVASNYFYHKEFVSISFMFMQCFFTYEVPL